MATRLAFEGLFSSEPIVFCMTTFRTYTKYFQANILEIIYTTVLCGKTTFELTEQHNL